MEKMQQQAEAWRNRNQTETEDNTENSKEKSEAEHPWLHLEHSFMYIGLAQDSSRTELASVCACKPDRLCQLGKSAAETEQKGQKVNYARYFGPRAREHWGQDGDMGQTDTRKINGECRQQKLTPGHFLRFKN